MPDHERDLRQEWEPMRLTALGHVGDVVRGGGGKLTPVPGDPGEIFKPPGGPG